MPTTWNPLDKDSNVSLSGGDLVASESTDGQRYSVRATQSRSSGKYYFEVQTDADGSCVGIMVAASSLVGLIGDASTDYGFLYSGGTFYRRNNSSLNGVDSGLSESQPMTLMVAVDLDAGKVWGGYNGTWGAGGDPAAGTGEQFSSVSGTFFPAWGGSFNGAATGTAHFSNGSLAYLPPTGFDPWDGADPGVTVGSAAGAAVVTGIGTRELGIGESSGTSTTQAYSGDFGTAIGAATATAVGLAVRQGAGSAAGRSFVYGSYVTTIVINRLIPQGFWLIRRTDVPYSQDGFVYTGTDITGLNDGNLDGAPYVSALGDHVYVAKSAAVADTVVIYSSSLNPSDQAAYPTFELADNGLIGDAATERLFVAIDGAPAGISTNDPAHAKAINRVIGNRLTRLEFKLTAPSIVTEIFICSDDGANLQPLAAGTVITEIQLLSTYTIHTAVQTETANATSEVKVGRTITLESSGAASSTVIEKGYAKLTDGGVATSTVIGIGTEKAVGAAAGSSTSAAYTVLEEVLEDGGVATDLVTFSRKLALHSDGVLSTSLSGKVTHTEESTGEATNQIEGENSITQSEESTGNATSTVIGIRRVTVVEISGGVGSNASASRARAELTLLSHGQASSVAVQRSVQSETLESSGFAEETLSIPFQGTFPVFWTNSVSTGAATWVGLPFNSFIEADGVVYAAGPSGIFELGDELDDLNAEVSSEVEWDLSDNSSMQMKRMRSVYVNARVASPFTVRVANEQGIFEYQTETADTETVTNHRAAIGRGILSRNSRLSLLHTKAYTAEDAGVGVLESTRRI